MRSSLVVDRRRVDDTLTRIRYLLEVNYEEGRLTEEQKATIPVAVYEGFSYYLEMVCSRVVGGPNVSYILAEYMYGAHIKPNNYPVVCAELEHTFRLASEFVLGALQNLTQQVEANCEDVTDLQFIPSENTHLGVFMMESEPIVEENDIGRGLTEPVMQTYL